MPLLRPSTVTGLTSPYGFKGDFLSSAQNYIDIQFPNLAIVNGDNIFTGTNTITGTLDITNGTLNLNNSLFALSNNSVITMDASTNISNDGTWLQGADSTLAFTSGSQIRGTLDFNTCTVDFTDCTINLNTLITGNTVVMDSNTNITNNGTLTQGTSSNLIFSAGSHVSGNTTVESLTAAINASTLNYTLDNIFYNNSTVTYTATPVTFNSASPVIFNGGLTVNGSATFAGTPLISGIGTVTGALNFTGSGLLDMTTGTTLKMENGSNFVANPTSTLVLSGPISALIGTAVNYKTANVPLPGSGNVTLTSTQYNCPIIDMGGGVSSLSGSVTIVFPVTPGTWDVLVYAPGIGAGQEIEVTNGAGGYNSYIFGHNYDTILVTIHVVQTATTFTAGAMTCTNKV